MNIALTLYNLAIRGRVLLKERILYFAQKMN